MLTVSSDNFIAILLSYDFIKSLAVIVIFLIYLVIIRPFRIFAIPKMLTRIGICIIFLIASLLCVFGLITASYHQGGSIFSYLEASSTNSLFVILYVHCCFFPLSNIFTYTALYEFICAQSPHSMKGLLIGLSFAIKGFFQVLAAAMIIPFFFIDYHYLNCGVYYYMMNCVVGVVILWFMCVWLDVTSIVKEKTFVTYIAMLKNIIQKLIRK